MKNLSNSLAFTIVLLALSGLSVSGAEEFTNRRDIMQNEEFRRDFNIQGEYLATVEDFKVGLQLIADSNGKFRFVAYMGGLPGEGWKAGEVRFLGTAELKESEFTFTLRESKGKDAQGNEASLPQTTEGIGKIILERPERGPGGPGGPGARPRGNRPEGAGGPPPFRNFQGFPVKIEVPAKGDLPKVVFEKTFRTSPSLGEKAPEGALVVFDGSNVEKFKQGAKMEENRFGGNTLWAEATSQPFENKPYRLHLEFMLSYMPQSKGQARSNSGVYIYQSYECQVLDSFGLEGENNECGGFYTIAKPQLNMCFPPMVWQTYDFDITPPKFEGDKKVANTRLSLKHNGVLIHDNIELPGATPGCLPEGPDPRGVYLQGHGNKVQYRNIWVQYK